MALAPGMDTMHDTRKAPKSHEMADDGLSDDIIDTITLVPLPNPELGNLGEIENMMRAASATGPGRDSLAKFIMNPESPYIPKLVPLLEMAEDLEDVQDLHKLCNIMKTLILLNDTAIIEYVVSDTAILGVVGALECREALIHHWYKC